MEESRLSERQRKWLEASRKIGPGAMTKTERETLEQIYAQLLPVEQQELAAYIQEKFGKKEEDSAQPEQGGPAQDAGAEPDANLPVGDDPTAKMEQKSWEAPSNALLQAFSRPQKPGK